jgi:hypothetical protein
MADDELELTPLTRVSHREGGIFTPVGTDLIYNRIEKSSWRTKSRSFLRAIGARLFSPTSNLQHSKSKYAEEKKVVMEKSGWVALAQCCIHILPVLGSITLFWLNFYGYYIGAQLDGPSGLSDNVKLHLLQFLAKVHEGLIIASTAAIVSTLVRNQLLYGRGIPLGLIGSRMSFSEVSYFWYV